MIIDANVSSNYLSSKVYVELSISSKKSPKVGDGLSLSFSDNTRAAGEVLGVSDNFIEVRVKEKNWTLNLNETIESKDNLILKYTVA